jgi:hypothetical protein
VTPNGPTEALTDGTPASDAGASTAPVDAGIRALLDLMVVVEALCPEWPAPTPRPPGPPDYRL